MAKRIAIIGAGMGGLAAGIYAQMNGYETEIYEAHTRPGGQCASWQRNGYTFDACIHHLMGCSEGSRVYGLWKELGVMPRDLATTRELVAVASPKGEVFYDYYDLDELRAHMLDIAPEDANAISGYIKGIRSFIDKDMMGRLVVDSPGSMLRILPTLIANIKNMSMPLGDYAQRFHNPLLRRALSLLEYSIPGIPVGVHFAKHAAGTGGDIAWPIAASGGLSASMAERYTALGGRQHLGKRVEKVLTRNNHAVGLRLAGGDEVSADIVISAADGRKTIFDFLDGAYLDDELRSWAAPPDDVTNWGTMVYFGVNRDLSREPSALVILLDEAVTLTGLPAHSMELQTYGFDPSMAPPGKGVIKAELVSAYSYWDGLTPEEYEAKKQQAAEQALSVLEQYFTGLRSQVETVDVVTLKTWEQFMGGTNGFANGPKKPFGLSSFMGKPRNTLPGLSGFYMAGIWVSGVGALFGNAQSGKNTIRQICRQDGKTFGVL